MSNITSIEEEIFIQRSPRSKATYQKALKYLPDGVTRGTSTEPYPLFWDKGEDQYIFDIDGIKRIDFFGNNSSLPFGHANANIFKRVNEQINKGVSFNAPHESHIELAQILCERIKSIESVRFTNSGTEATMNCIHAARAFTGKSKVVKVDGAYHGIYDAVAYNTPGSISNSKNTYPTNNPSIPSMSESNQNDVIIIPFNNPDIASEIIKKNKSDIAAVIVEPMMGGAGFIQAEKTYLQSIREITEKENIILIFDEVCSLRAGYGAGQGYFDIYPDLSAFGKSLGGGTPIGAFGGKKEIMDLYSKEELNRHVQHSGSFNGNPLSMVSGIATFNQLTKPVYDHLDNIANKLRDGIKSVCAEFEVPVQVTGIGSLFCVHFNDNIILSSNDAAKNDKLRTQQVFLGLLNEGIWPSSNLLGAVSATMTLENIDAYLNALSTVLARNS